MAQQVIERLHHRAEIIDIDDDAPRPPEPWPVDPLDSAQSRRAALALQIQNRS